MTTKPLLLLLCVLAVACGTTTPPTLPPVIPTTTKVADDNTRNALVAYDATTGTMRFSKVTASLAALQADDVLVSEPSVVAPNGYLRKIKAIRQEGAAVVLETTQANLTDAIHQGTLNASGDLRPEDLRSARALLPGVNVGVVPPSQITAQSSVDVGDGYRFYVGFDKTILDINEPNVKAKVQVTGELKFNAGYNVHFDIDGPSLIPPRAPSLERFEAWVGFEERARLRVTGDANAKMTKEIKVAEYRFAPKCFVILVVPVCVVPTVYVFVGASGEINLHFDYMADQSAQSKLGASWSSGAGWQKLDPKPSLTTTFNQQLEVNAALKARAYLKADAALMLYGISGLAVSGQMGLELDAAFPRNPLWVLRGSIEGAYKFIVDVPIVGRLGESGDALFTFTKEAARSQNTAPKLALTGRNTTPVPLALPTTLGPSCGLGFGDFFYNAYDPEDACAMTITLTSSVDGAISFNHVFQTAGPRTITVTAKDTNGASSSIGFDITVVNTPPTVYGSVPSSTQATVPTFFSIAALDPNTGRVDCDAITVSGVTAQAIGTQNGDCQYSVTFAQEGTQTITAFAKDPQGGTSSTKNFVVLVKPKPVSPPPVWKIPPGLQARDASNTTVIVPNEGSTYGDVILSASATDPNGKAITYTWQAVFADGSVYTLTPEADGGVRAGYCNVRVQFRVVASNGESQNNPLTQYVNFNACIK